MSEEQHNLKGAPPAVQIAVDLIQLLEENKIDNKTAIEALKIVLNDFQKSTSEFTCTLALWLYLKALPIKAQLQRVTDSNLS